MQRIPFRGLGVACLWWAMVGAATGSPGQTISITPGTLTFAAAAVGATSAAQVVTITNTGESAITFTASSAISGPEASSFVKAASTCYSPLPAGASCTNSIEFKPTTTGALTATLSYADTAAGSPQTVTLNGTGGTTSGPSLSITPGTVTFAATAVGSTAAAQMVTITNTGTTPVTFTASSAISGPGASSFVKAASTCYSPFPAGASCTNTVEFKPTGAGTFAATLSYADTAAGSPQTVGLSGTGTSSVGTSLSITPATLTFGATTLGSTSAAQIVTITNTGTTPVTFTASSSISGAEASSFMKTASTCYSPLPAGASCTNSIEFAPTAAGALTATLSYPDSAPGSPQMVTLNGTGGAAGPSLSFTPGALTFASTAVGTATAAQMVTITNTGSTPVTFTASSSIGGAGAGSFMKTASTCYSPLPAGASCTNSVVFKPTTAGVFAATLSYPDNAVGSPQTVALSGTGSGLSISPSALTFPATVTGTTAAAQMVIVANGTSSTVTINSVSLGGANAGAFAQTNTCGTLLAAGANCAITATFTPAAVGGLAATLTVVSNQSAVTQSVQLEGAGSAPIVAPHAVVSNPQPSLFYAGSSYDVTLSNAGNAPLTISGITLATTNDTLTYTCGSSLAPGASCVASIHTQTPTFDQLTFATNDPDLAPLVIAAYDSYSNPPIPSLNDLFFANTIVGESSAAQTFTFNSVSTFPPPITGPNAADFTVSPMCADYDQVPCVVTVTFTPSGSGLRTAKFSINANGEYIPLGGYGVASTSTGDVTLSETSANFYDSLAPSPQIITVSNYGSSAVTMSVSIESLLGASEYTQTNNCGSSLAAQSVCNITVTSSRQIEGGSEALMSIAGDFGAFSVPLSNYLDFTYDFGDVLLGANTSTSFTTVGGSQMVTVTGQSASDFTVVPCNSDNGNCSIEATFAPTAVGSRTANANLQIYEGSGVLATQSYFLIGTGITTAVPNAIVSAEDGLVSVRNGGPTVLSPSISFSGQPASNFISESPNTCVGALQPGATCTENFTYQAPQYGFSTATVTVTDETSGKIYSQPMNLFTDIGPALSSTSLMFPGTLDNSVSAPLSITVIPYFRHAVSASAPAPFFATKGSCAADEVPCVLSFVFAPTFVGSYGDAIQIFDVYEGTETGLMLTGNGVAPTASGEGIVSPTSLTFPLRPVGTTSIPMTVTVSNSGGSSFAISSIGLSGANAAEFSMTSGCGASLAVGTNCTVNVSFAPTVAGQKAASLVIYGDSAAGLPITVPITGSAQ